MIGNAFVTRFILSRACSSLGDKVLMFAVPLIVYRDTRSVAMSGLAFFIEWLPRVVSLPIAGTIADRLGGWRIYPVADGIRAVACLAAALLVLRFPHDTFAVVTALIALSAFLFSQILIATEVTVARLVSPPDMPKAQSLLQGVDQASMIGGPALAALAVVWLSPLALLWGVALLFAASALNAWLLRGAFAAALAPLGQPAARRFADDFAVGLRLLRETPVLVKITALSMMVNLTVGLAFSTSAAVTVGRFGLPNSYYGILQIAIGAMMLATFALIPYLTARISVFAIGIGSYAAIVAGGALMGFATSFPVFAAGLALASGLTGMFNVYMRTERVQWIPKEHLGKVIGLIVLLNQATLPLAGLLVSALADRTNVQTLFVLTALAAALLGLGLATSLQRTSKTTVLQTKTAKATA